MAPFDRYMTQYDHEHTNSWNKLLHGIGIPMIIAGIAPVRILHSGASASACSSADGFCCSRAIASKAISQRFFRDLCIFWWARCG